MAVKILTDASTTNVTTGSREKFDPMSLPRMQGSINQPVEESFKLIPEDDGFCHFRAENGSVNYVDGAEFDKDIIINDISQILKNFRFNTPGERHAFLVKVCAMFSLPTTIANLSDEEMLENAKNATVPDFEKKLPLSGLERQRHNPELDEDVFTKSHSNSQGLFLRKEETVSDEGVELYDES